jgi:hypothetical protein
MKLASTGFSVKNRAMVKKQTLNAVRDQDRMICFFVLAVTLSVLTMAIALVE